MTSKFTSTPIKKIGRVVTGKTPSTAVAENFNGDYMFVTPSELHTDFIIETSEKTLTRKGLDSIRTNTVKGLSVAVGCIGWDMGNVALINEECATNQQINSLTDFNTNKYNPYYVYYWLLTKKSYLFQIATVTRTPILNKSTFEDILIPLPLKSVQDKVASVLLPISRKIALNNAINAELENMARLLYCYWFVQFDFPDENGKPYKSSGGAMVWNEQLKREIPEGWEISSINDMTTACRGVSYDKGDILSDSENGVLVLRGNNIQENRLIYDNNTVYVPKELVSDEQLIRKHDIILTMSSGSKEHIGKCAMFHYDSPHTFGAFLSKFTPQKDKRFFVFQSMISDFCFLKIKAICNGTGINNLTSQTFNEILFAVPDSNTLRNYEKRVRAIYSKVGANELENTELTELRDFLLPLLMNGQVTVKTEKT